MRSDNLIDLALEMGSYEWAKQLVEMKRNPKLETIEEVKQILNTQNIQDNNKQNQHKALQDISDPFVIVEDYGIRPVIWTMPEDIQNGNIALINTEKYFKSDETQFGVYIKQGDMVEIDSNVDINGVRIIATYYNLGKNVSLVQQNALMNTIMGIGKTK